MGRRVGGIDSQAMEPATAPDPSAPSPAGPDTAQTPFDRFGGHDFFDLLVERFYAGVAEDAELRALYPEADLGPAAERLQLFLEQFWGGPTTYVELRGHPRLRMRHAEYAIDVRMHDAWLRHMRAALDEAAVAFELSPEDEREQWDYLTRAAFAMVNTYPGPA